MFQITGTSSKFECTASTFAGTVVNNATTATVDPKYTGEINETPHNTVNRCNSNAGDVVIDMNGCHYVLTGSTTKEDPPPAGLDAEVWIQCGGNPIQITNPGFGVTVSVPSQTPTNGGVSYKNLSNHPGGAAVEVTATATGITTTCAPTFTCTLGGIPHHANTADYNGILVATGYEDKNGLPTPVEEERISIAVNSS